MNVTSVLEFTQEVIHSQSASKLQSIHKVVSLNRAQWHVAWFMPIKQLERNRTLVGKQRGERSTVIAWSHLKVLPRGSSLLEMDAHNEPSISAASEPASVEFIQADNPGAALDECLAAPGCFLLFHAGGSSVMRPVYTSKSNAH